MLQIWMYLTISLNIPHQIDVPVRISLSPGVSSGSGSRESAWGPDKAEVKDL